MEISTLFYGFTYAYDMIASPGNCSSNLGSDSIKVQKLPYSKLIIYILDLIAVY